MIRASHRSSQASQPVPSRATARTALRAAGCLGVVGLLSACAGGQQVSGSQEAAKYEQRAMRSYTPPGSRSDPWGPYIVEASAKYDVPERWIREVMRVESGGRTEINGVPITSGAGAMGLMQVMPATYDELRARYGLGSDPYDPHNSILAGTAYIRELYDLYGSPGFLAAYNGGPGRLDDYLTRNRALPDETRRYVAKIGPYITDSFPNRRSTAEMYAMNSLPTSIPAGPRYNAPNATAAYVPPVAPPQAPVEVAFAPPSDTDGAFDPPPGWKPKGMSRSEVAAYVPPPAPAPQAPARTVVAAADIPPMHYTPDPQVPAASPAYTPAPLPVRQAAVAPDPDGAFDPPPGWKPKGMSRSEVAAYVPPPAPAPQAPARTVVAAAEIPPMHYTPDLPARAAAPAYTPPPLPGRQAGVPLPVPPEPVRGVSQYAAVQSALQLPTPPLPTVQPAAAYGFASAAPKHDSFRLVGPAYAAPAPLYHGAPGGWAIQVGAFGNEGLARLAAGNAREQAGAVLSGAKPAVAGIKEAHSTLYRARLLGLSRESATQACDRLKGHSSCIVLSPDAQS